GYSYGYGVNENLITQKDYEGSSFSPDIYASFSIIPGPLLSLNCHFSYASFSANDRVDNEGEKNLQILRYSPMISIASPPNNLPFLNHFIAGISIGYNAVSVITNDSTYPGMASGSFVAGGFISTRPGNPGLYFDVGCYVSPQTVKTHIPSESKSLIFEAALGYGFQKLPVSLSLGFASGYFCEDSTSNVDGYSIPGFSELDYATFSFSIHWFIANYNMKIKPERKSRRTEEIVPDKSN
ncbi:MAG: hypothetical protein WBM07_04155, partial [Chitinivibrionales bacterium]